MEKTKKYVQFPLCALAFGSDVQDRLRIIQYFALVEAGLKGWERLLPHQHERISDELFGVNSPPEDQEEWDLHVAVLYGARILGIKVASIAQTLAHHGSLKHFQTNFEAEYGRDAMVRIRQDIFRDAQSGRINYRDSSVLCAIYSSLGDKPFMRLTRDAIRCRALGYKSVKCAGELLGKRTDDLQPLTDSQIRTTLNALEGRGFFVRLNPSPRKSYFSHRLNLEQLKDAVVGRETLAFERLTARRRAGADAQVEIQQRKASMVLNAVAKRLRP